MKKIETTRTRTKLEPIAYPHASACACEKCDGGRSAYEIAMRNFKQSPAAWNIAKAVRDKLNETAPFGHPISAFAIEGVIRDVLAAEMVAGRIEFTDKQGTGL